MCDMALPPEKRQEWTLAQRDWPTTLYLGQAVVSMEDCERLRAEASHWLKQDLSEDDRAFVVQFHTRVTIHWGDLKSDTFRCTLGECG